MREITYNGITVYMADNVLLDVRKYIALNEIRFQGIGAYPYPEMSVNHTEPSQAPLHYMAPLRPSQAPLPSYAAPPQSSQAPAAAPKRRRGIFSGFKISHKNDAAKAEREETVDAAPVCEDRPPAPQGSPAPAYHPAPQEMSVCSDQAAGPIDDILSKAEDTFQAHLLKLIDKKALADSEVYKKADIDRRHFSKIRSNPEYRPKKQTALALALALELNIDEAVDLLGRAGYAFSPSSRSDLIARYCIENEIYDLMEVNALLFYYDQPLLGGQM